MSSALSQFQLDCVQHSLCCSRWRVWLRSAALAETMVAYATLFFGDTGAADVYGKDGKLEVVMSGQSSNERNKWSGSWRSWWTVDVAGKTISGKVRIVTHYYENGNMQLHSQKEFEPKPLTFEVGSVHIVDGCTVVSRFSQLMCCLFATRMPRRWQRPFAPKWRKRSALFNRGLE